MPLFSSVVVREANYESTTNYYCQGGSKHDGIAAVLRIRHGASLPACGSSQSIKGGDAIDVAVRRTVPSRKSSEVAAIALGMKTALRRISPSCRKRVLILSDSEYALDFFCGSENNDVAANGIAAPPSIRRPGAKRKRRKGTASAMKGKSRQATQAAELRDEAHRRTLTSLVEDTPHGITFAKVRSSSRGVEMSGAVSDDDADDAPWDGIGFIDHDVADYLSSATRSVPNGNEYEMEPSLLSPVKALGNESLTWLRNSDGNISTDYRGSTNPGLGSETVWKPVDVVGREMRDDRQKRNQRRTDIIQDMLGPLDL